jgi:hypothetical protein
MIGFRESLEAKTVAGRGVFCRGVRACGSNDGIVSDLGGNQRMVPTHRDGARGADWTRVALRAGDPGGGVHRVNRELSFARTIVFIPRWECGVHCCVHDGRSGIAAGGEDRLASAIHEGCNVAAADRNLLGVHSGVRGDEVPAGRRLDPRAGIFAGNDELVGWGRGGDRIDRAIFFDLYFARAAAIPGLLGKRRGRR